MLISRRTLLSTAATWLASSLLGGRAAAVAPSAAPVIALIIDDVGYNRVHTMPFITMGVPITFSVLPHLCFSTVMAERAHHAGHEVMLHQPMEPHTCSINPGPGALYLKHDRATLTRIITTNLASMPFVHGVNNHMGSRFTECRAKMAAMLRPVREHGLFFVDSYTSSRSVAYQTACELQMPTSHRDIFLDNIWEEAYITGQLRKLVTHARRHGQAIGIGHPRPETARALHRFLDRGLADGCSFRYASHLIAAPARSHRMPEIDSAIL